jgi:hypothetical protein
MSKSKENDAVETIVMYKAEKMKKSRAYKIHIKNVLKDYYVEATKEDMETFIMGGVDAMIFDVGSALGFTRNTSKIDGWTSWKKRREMLKKIFNKRKGKKHTT